MKNIVFVLFFALLLCGCSRRIARVEPGRGVTPAVSNLRQANYELGRAILPGALGFVGGGIDTDTQRGRFAQQGIFLGATISIGAWGKRPAKFYFLDLGAGLVGAALGFTVKNQIKRR